MFLICNFWPNVFYPLKKGSEKLSSAFVRQFVITSWRHDDAKTAYCRVHLVVHVHLSRRYIFNISLFLLWFCMLNL